MLLLVVALALAVLSFFAMLELLLTVAALLISQTIDSTVRQRYSLVTVRNLWLLGGGALLVGLVIGGTEYFIKRLGNARSRRLLLCILLVEIVIIGLAVAVTG